MATLVFSTVGTMFGGPIGGAIGALVGRQVDAALFGSPRREGPRLKELQVTTSSYGQVIPRHFGRMRVAGQMIWATDLVEASETQGGGKGSPSVTTYSYTANFAVALASRPILGIGRIWADGKLLRGEAGDLKVGGAMRLYTGTGDQPPDPLLLASEGQQRCPAYRGLAYAVFEDLDLSEYYNHIPALTFEVIADETFGLEDIVGELVEEVDAAVALDGIAGFSSEGPLAESLLALDPILPLDADVSGERLVIARERLQESAILLPEPTVASGDDEFGRGTGYSRHREAAASPPLRQLRYFDRDRDYQPGLQRASGQPAPGEPGTVDLPAALDTATARRFIERAARRSEWMRDRVTWRTNELDTAVAPGSVLVLPGLSGQWRVLEWEWRDTGIELSLERVLPTGAGTAPQTGVDGGRIQSPRDEVAGSTRLVVFEAPWDGITGSPDVAAPRASVSSDSAGWSGAALYADRGDGQLLPLGPSGRTRSIIGSVELALPPASPLILDRTTQVIVSLVDPDMVLDPATSRQLANGANLAVIGEELVQFSSATALGGGQWRLEGLLRGRGGTEGAIAGHQPGEDFALLDGTERSLDPAILADTSADEVVAIGRGDEGPARAPVALAGLTLRPLCPVHPALDLLAGGDHRYRWTRRARGAWRWKDGVETPLVEESESYLVLLGPVLAPKASWTTSSPELALPAATLASLAAAHGSQPLSVLQSGTHGLSAPLYLGTVG